MRVILSMVTSVSSATDLSDNVSIIQTLETVDQKSISENSSDDEKCRFYQLLMVCSKISDHARVWEHALEIGDRLYTEYHRAKQPTCGTRIFVIPDIDNLPMRARLQSHFLTSICFPAFKILQRFYPDTMAGYLENLETNVKKLDTLYRQLKKQEIAETGGDNASGVSIDAGDDGN